MVFFIIGIIDLLAGIIISFSSSVIFPEVTRYIGYILIAKGIWTLISDVGYLMARK